MNLLNLVDVGGGVDNAGGVNTKFWYAPLDYFQSIKKPVDEPTDVIQRTSILETHEFKPGKGFHKGESILNSGQFKAMLTGDRGGRGMKFESMCQVVQEVQMLLGNMDLMKNQRMIFLFKFPSGKVIQIGSEDIYAEATGIEYDSAKLEEGVNSLKFSAVSFNYRPTFYFGDILEFPDAGNAPDLEVSINLDKVVHDINPSVDGPTVKFKVVLVNRGFAIQSNVKTKITFEGTHVANTASSGSYNATTGIWTISGNVIPGIPEEIEIEYTPLVTGPLKQIKAVSTGSVLEYNIGNNAATRSIKVILTP